MAFGGIPYVTHLHIPLVYILEGINSNVKVLQEAKDLNPKQEGCCEKFIDCLVYLLKAGAINRGLHKVACPEFASIL